MVYPACVELYAEFIEAGQPDQSGPPILRFAVL